MVHLTGEGYFEVVKNTRMPFHVMVEQPVGTTDVEVLGTHFNVNAYDDEPSLTATLLEGSVKVTTGQQAAVLKPGQQAIEDKIILRVCKQAAVKAGQVLSPEQMQGLIRQLERCQSPRTCPHGRPTMIQLSAGELEKAFGRI